MEKSYTKEVFKILFRLSKKQPWLSEKEDELLQLFFDDCKSDNQKELIIRLIDNFEFISKDRYAELVAELITTITNTPTLSEETTQVVATACGDESDSSQYLLYDLKIGFDSSKWVSPTLVNNFGAAYKNFKRNSNLTNIVLVDEFVGSGQTVEGRIKEIQRQFQSNSISNIQIYAYFLIGCEAGIKRISSLTKNTSAVITLRRGISDHFPPEKVSSAIEEMKQLENVLSEKWDDEELPSLGFGGTEALYYRSGGNPPNNNFPIFWWPLYKDGNLRRTVLRRVKSKK